MSKRVKFQKKIFNLDILISIYKFVDLKTKRKAFFTFWIMFITAIFESLAVLAVMPLILEISGSLNNEKVLEKTLMNQPLNSILNNDSYAIPFFILLITIAGTLKVLDLFMSAQLTVMTTHELSKKTFMQILQRPYEYHLYSDLGDITATLTSYVRDTYEFIYNFLRFFSSILILFSLTITLIIVNFKITIFSFSILALVYLLLSFYSKNKLIDTSLKHFEAANYQTKLVQETFNSIREVKIWNAYKLFNENYKKADIALRNTQRNRIVIGSSPRFIIETVGIITIAIVCIFANLFTPGGNNIIPIIATFSLGVQRLLPSVNQMYVGWTYLNSFKKSTKYLLDILKDNSYTNEIENIKNLYFLKSSIEFRNVSFKYLEGDNNIFNEINLKFNKRDIIGISGKSGSGKSTLIDLLSGMLLPTSGKIFVDNKILNQKSKRFLLSWRSSLSYVSQNIYLTKGNFIDNIAFGIETNKVDMQRLKYVSQLAMIDEYINSTNEGYYGKVYENGKNLSGGQIQRLGIARALYRSDNLIIFDEATTALDPKTESKIFQNIINAKKDTTIFLISHNPNVLRYCNKIFKLNKGKIIQI